MRHGRVGERDRAIAWKWRLFSIGLIPLTFLVHVGASRIPVVISEAYSLRIYPVLATPLVFLSDQVSFSLAELSYVVGGAVVVWALGITVIRLFRRSRTWRNALLRGALNVLTVIGLLYALITVVWALNYHRTGLARAAGLDPSAPTPEELRGLCVSLIDEANELRSSVEENEDGLMVLPHGWRDALRRAEIGYRYAQLDHPWLPVRPIGRPKGIVFSRVMSATGFTGFYFPFSGEANVNIDEPDCTLPHTVSHEIAHQLGFAHEGEANFLGYIACRAHPDIDFRYSGTFASLVSAMVALRATDRETHDELFGTMHEGVRRDWRAVREFWRTHVITVARKPARAVVDANLKLHSDPSGIASYGQVVDLLIAERRARLAEAETDPDAGFRDTE
jgi:hypothetical protein